MIPRRALVAALCLLAAACGKSAEAARLDAFQATCLSVRGMSYTQAVQAFQVAPDPTSPDGGSTCPPQPPLEPVANTNDACNYPGVCQAWWSSLAGDSSLCSSFGCWFGCEIRFPSGGDPAAIVCMARFFSGEPCPHGFTGC